MAVKRRVIWMSDVEWAALNQVAQMRGESVSRVLRDFLTLSRLATDDEYEVITKEWATRARERPAFTSGDIPPSSGGPLGWSQEPSIKRASDELRDRFNSRGSRPAPKKAT